MVEHISMSSTMQTRTLQSVKSAENAKTQEVSEKETSVAKSDESRKYDRFEYSNEVSYVAGSPDDPKAREAFDAKRNAVQTNDSRSYDRVEFSAKYLSDSSAKLADGVEATDMSNVKSSDVHKSDSPSSTEEVSSQSASDDSSESVDTNKLYQYTDTELKDFLLDGSITQSEYDAEIAKREI